MGIYRKVFNKLKGLTILNVLNGCTVRYIQEEAAVPGVSSAKDENMALVWETGKLTDSMRNVEFNNKKYYLTEGDAEKFEMAMIAQSKKISLA